MYCIVRKFFGPQLGQEFEYSKFKGLMNISAVERTPLSSKHEANSSLLLCSANLQSVKSQGKSSVLLDYILKTDIDVFAMTETWLRDNDTAASLEFFPSETYKLFQLNRLSGRNGGGTALLIKKSSDVRKIESRKINSFEYSEFTISTDSFKARILIIYCPPYSTVHPMTPATLFEEFSSYLESINGQLNLYC